jgi:2,3-bisphosphoglycerate-independent phosphoglycerate mutase
MIYKGALPNLVTVPPHDYIGQDISKYLEAYQQNADWGSLLARAAKLLKDHPVNLHRIQNGQNPATLIWLWGEGKMPSVPTLTERFNISGTMISAVDLLKGLGVLAGLSVANVEGATGFIDTNYEGKAQAAIDALRRQDFVFVHLEAPDESGHQGSLKNKITAIEDFDGRIVQPIVKSLRCSNVDFRVVVTMDHFTPLSLRTHVSDPVPTILYDSREQKNGSDHLFSEASCTVYSRLKNNAINNGHQLIEKLFEQEI